MLVDQAGCCWQVAIVRRWLLTQVGLYTNIGPNDNEKGTLQSFFVLLKFAFNMFVSDQEAIDTAEKLKRNYDCVIALWHKKHLRMRQNMIFATIKVVKSWDFQQYISMEKKHRIAIRRALNEDSDKLIQVICFTTQCSFLGL